MGPTTVSDPHYSTNTWDWDNNRELDGTHGTVPSNWGSHSYYTATSVVEIDEPPKVVYTDYKHKFNPFNKKNKEFKRNYRRCGKYNKKLT